MAVVSTKQFYFAEFGGYRGLQDVLPEDLVEIADIAKMEMTQPGTYTNVLVAEMISHGNETYTIIFEAGGSFLHRETFHASSEWIRKIRELGGAGAVLPSVILTRANAQYSAGYMHEMYYLIDHTGCILLSFETAKDILDYCRQENITLNGAHVGGIELSNSRTTLRNT